jgi:hypothetical protein
MARIHFKNSIVGNCIAVWSPWSGGAQVTTWAWALDAIRRPKEHEALQQWLRDTIHGLQTTFYHVKELY